MAYVIRHNELSAEEFILLWSSVWDGTPSLEQTKLAMVHSLFRVSVFDDNNIIAMARVIGDMGLCYYIKDVVVRPEYQRKGIGSILLKEILSFIDSHGISGSYIAVELAALPDKIGFYEKLGFSSNNAKRLRLMYQVK
ncbi:MAG: GNAT family N-acetyltransferase [Ruminococcus sp.]|nr:GNAT family N-acetyltransferase [Ruminococcus sp.]